MLSRKTQLVSSSVLQPPPPCVASPAGQQVEVVPEAEEVDVTAFGGIFMVCVPIALKISGDGGCSDFVLWW